MKFGKSLERESQELPTEWQPYLLQYKELKKSIRRIVDELALPDRPVQLQPHGLSVRLEDGRTTQPHDVVYSFAGTGRDLHPILHITIATHAEAPVAALSLPTSTTITTTTLYDNPFDEPATSVTAEIALTPANTHISIADAREQLQDTLAEAISPSTISYELKADAEFFRQLSGTLGDISGFHAKSQAAYHARIKQVASLLAKGATPGSRDFYHWREIIELYITTEIWQMQNGLRRQATPAQMAREKLANFLKEDQRLGLSGKLRTGASRQTMQAFVQLLNELCNVRAMQSLNQLAVTKILKKHDKRTRLTARIQYPMLMSNDPFFTVDLSQAMANAICELFVAVVPRLDDYLCPICYGLCWKPIRLACRHVFCLRCLIKAQRSDMRDCPVCRHSLAVSEAYADQLDTSLMNMITLYFPQELRVKKREIDREVALEEARIISGFDWRTDEERGDSGQAVQRSDSRCVVM